MSFNPVKISILAVFLFGVMYYGHASAQTAPTFWVSWKASSYAPLNFRGKILPTENTPVEISFEIMENGKPADLSNNTVFWFAKDNLLAQGKNKKTVSFKNMAHIGEALNVEIRVIQYKGAVVTKTVTIPVVNPGVVINSPYNRSSLAEKTLRLTALPYYFNADSLADLKFNWDINGEAPPGEVDEPYKLTVNIPAGAPALSSVGVSVNVRNIKHIAEQTTGKTTYITR